MPKFEAPQKGNPHKLTVRQHFFPAKNIERFCGSDERVELLDLQREKTRRARKDDEAFVLKRAWDQKSESGFMADIEAQFNALADSIIIDGGYSPTADSERIIARFMSLWRYREAERHRVHDDPKIKGLTGPEQDLTTDEKERLESSGVSYINQDLTIPSRFITGTGILMRLDWYTKFDGNGVWRYVRAFGCEFVVPDRPLYYIIPLTPTSCLTKVNAQGNVDASVVAFMNQKMAEGSLHYLFARSLDRCGLQPIVKPGS